MAVLFEYRNGRFMASDPIFLIPSNLTVLTIMLAYQVISDVWYITLENIRTILDSDAFRLLKTSGTMTAKETGLFRNKVRAHIAGEMKEIYERIKLLCG